jgi:XTP/dITP diphosphohydrolase
VKTARYAGVGGTPIEIRNKVLSEMKDKSNRVASFQTAMVLAFPDGKYHIAVGKVTGSLLEELRPREYSGSQPFDPVFICDDFNPNRKTFAEMTIDEKNKISHRGRALKSLIEFLQKNDMTSLQC